MVLGNLPRDRISNYVCLSCSSVRLLLNDPVARDYICPKCGKQYYPKMHTMRRDPKTVNPVKLQNAANLQKGLLSLDDKKHSPQQPYQPPDPHIEHSPMIRYVSRNPYDRRTARIRKNVRMTSYMKTEGAYFKYQRIPQEIINMGAEITSFKETIE